MRRTTTSNTKNISVGFRVSEETNTRIESLAALHGGKTRLLVFGVDIIHRIDQQTMDLLKSYADEIETTPARVIADIVNASHNKLARALRRKKS